MSQVELKRWQESEPERLEARARAWRKAAFEPGAQVKWLFDLANQAMDAAARLREFRAARLRSEYAVTRLTNLSTK
jgi:hypothetical protein